MSRHVAHDLLRETAGLPGRPDQHVAFISVNDLGEIPAVLNREADLAQPFGPPGKITLVLIEIIAIVRNYAATIQSNNGAIQRFAFDALLPKLPADLSCDAHTGSPGAVHDGTTVSEGLAADTGSRVHRGCRNCARTLDIVVE